MLEPNYQFRRAVDILPDFLAEEGIRALVLDVDNTLALHGAPEPLDGVAEWLEQMAANGIRLVILSNNSGERVRPFARALKLPYIPRGCKPAKSGFERCRILCGCAKTEMAAVGDQLLTDIWGGKRYGIRTILVEPAGPEEAVLLRWKRKIENLMIMRWERKSNHGR